MGIFKSTYTVEIPEGAVIRKNEVFWKDKKGKKITGKLTRNGRASVESKVWWMFYTDEIGQKHKESTGVESREAAERIFQRKITEIERIKSGVLRRDELDQAAAFRRRIGEYLGKYRVSMESKNATEKHISETIHRITDFCESLRIETLGDFTLSRAETWIAGEIKSKVRSPRTINAYLIAVKGFLNWCIDHGYFSENPLKKIKKLNEAVDKRKDRRSLSEEELKKLFAATGARKYRRENKAEEHELIYRLLAGTGLRSGELGESTVSQWDFKRCTFRVQAAKTKNRKDDVLPIRPDLCERLKKWVEKNKIPAGERIFDYTVYSIYKSFMRDCKAAGIETKSADGRSVDVHSLRRTFGTMLARAGVPLTTTQRLMRHSTPELTAKLYIDVEPIDMIDAIGKLPVI